MTSCCCCCCCRVLSFSSSKAGEQPIGPRDDLADGIARGINKCRARNIAPFCSRQPCEVGLICRYIPIYGWSSFWLSINADARRFGRVLRVSVECVNHRLIRSFLEDIRGSGLDVRGELRVLKMCEVGVICWSVIVAWSIKFRWKGNNAINCFTDFP